MVQPQRKERQINGSVDAFTTRAKKVTKESHGGQRSGTLSSAFSMERDRCRPHDQDISGYIGHIYDVYDLDQVAGHDQDRTIRVI